MSFWSRRGSDNMFAASRDEQGRPTFVQLAPDGASKDFLSAVKVFQGELTCCRLGHWGGKACCDREELVTPMLGLYAEMYANRHVEPLARQVCEAIEPQIEQIFPSTFEYADGKRTVEKPLFGDLVQVLRHSIDAEQGRASAELRVGKMQPGSNKDVKHGSKRRSTIDKKRSALLSAMPLDRLSEASASRGGAAAEPRARRFSSFLDSVMVLRTPQMDPAGESPPSSRSGSASQSCAHQVSSEPGEEVPPIGPTTQDKV